MSGYITINDDTLFCKILYYDLSKRVFEVNVNEYILYNIPFDEIQADKNNYLPWIC